MKVFTVGLDQKPPIKDASDPAAEKAAEAGSPPPGYATATKVARVPLPMGPEMPQPPTPIVLRKSRGYKGILMVMLAVFLMALFALTLSEIAYNRQRDENFFRLRWAEMKHRLGYGESPYGEYYRRAMTADRFYSFNKNRELAEALAQQAEPTSTSTTMPPTSTADTVVIDSFPIRPQQPQSFELNSANDNDALVRDARLQFLKTILSKIKQHAEDMGFDGTMQVSVIEVEPQGEENGQGPFGAGPFAHFPGAMGPRVDDRARASSFGRGPVVPPSHPFLPQLSIDDHREAFQAGPQAGVPFQGPFNGQAGFPRPRSESFLDGFGEFHQPSFLQNNQVVEQSNRGRQVEPNAEVEMPFPESQSVPLWARGAGGPAPGPRPPFDLFWAPVPQHMQQIPQGPQMPQGPFFPQGISQGVGARPFDRWSQPMGENSRDSDDGSASQQQHGPSMMQLFPQQPQAPQMPILPPMIDPLAERQQNGAAQNLEPAGSQNSAESESNGAPSQEVVGEMYGRKFGRMLQDIIANRIHGFNSMQQQPQVNLVPPEDRIQIEPPQTFPNPPQPIVPVESGTGPSGSSSSSSSSSASDEPGAKTVVVDGNMPQGGARAWTHQQQQQQQQQQLSLNSQKQQAESGDDDDEQEEPAVVSGEAAERRELESNMGDAFPEPTERMVDGGSEQAPSEQQQQDRTEHQDVWLTGPPNFGQKPAGRFQSTGIPVDFPAVKFPLNGVSKESLKEKAKLDGEASIRADTNNNNNADNDNAGNSGPLEAPQNADAQQQHHHPVMSNPVFFQVDDPSSVEQRPVAA